jgi:iron complex outermembrane recepter protein
MKNQSSRWAVLAAAALFAALVPPGRAVAADVTVEIKAQPLKEALREFGTQTGVQVMYRSEEVSTAGVTAPAVSGRLSAEEALTRLLSQSRFRYEFVNPTTVRIWDPDERDTTRIEETPPPSSTTYSDRDPSPNNSVQARLTVLAVPSIPEVLVNGSRSLNSDIQRSPDAAQPYVVLDRESIEQSGARTLEDFLQQRLSASTAYNVGNQAGVTGSTVSQISLRGLSSKETLILIDGRRSAGIGVNGDSLQPDLNSIPLEAIERIEVLPTTASGIYGGGATGGVINVVLKRDYTGVQGQLTYGDSFHSGATSRRVDLSAGFNLEEGRTSLLITGSYSDANPLPLGGRDLEQRRRAAILQRNPALILDASIPPLGATTNIRSASGEDLTLIAGNTSLGSPITSVPTGYAGIASDGGAALAGNAGRYNLDLANTAQNRGAQSTLLGLPTIRSLSATLRRQFGSSFAAFVATTASSNRGESRTSTGDGTFFIASGDPANPFTQDLLVTTPEHGTDQTARTEVKNLRVVVGGILTLPGDWRTSLDYAWNRARYSSTTAAAVDSAAAGLAISSGALDIFRDTNLAPPAFSTFLLDRGHSGPADTLLQDISWRLGGPLGWKLPGGHVNVAALLEHRKETLDDFFTSTVFSADFALRKFAPERYQKVDSAYLEAVLPFVSASNARPGLRLLELQLAGRHDRYTTTSAQLIDVDENRVPLAPIVTERATTRSTDPTVGLRFRPVNDLMLRASYGTGFLPPSVNQLVSSGTFDLPLGAFFGLTDPGRGGELIGTAQYTVGGNPDLDPEESDSRSVGLVLTPRVTPGLRVSLDWTRIRKTEAIDALNVLNQSALETLIRLHPERLTRSTDPATFGAFGVGPITAVDDTLVNISSVVVDALDVAVDYRLATPDTGTYSFSLAATHLEHKRTRVTPDSPEVEYVGYLGDLKWRANATLAWDYRNATVSWSARYFHSACVQLGCGLDPNQQAFTFPRQTYHDLYLGYRLGAAAIPALKVFSGIEMRAGINNIFDRLPPVVFDGTYSTFGDPRLRSYYLALRASLD